MDAATYLGAGFKYGAGVTIDTKTGQVLLRLSIGGGIGLGGGAGIGVSAKSDSLTAGSNVSLDARVNVGVKSLGGEGRYNYQTITNKRRMGSQGVAGAFSFGVGSGGYAAPLDASIDYAIPLGSIDSPCN